MKVLWVGDAVAATGFAACTHAACDALVGRGHDVTVLGINYYGDPHDHPYDIFPCIQPLDAGRDMYGVARLPVLVERHDPDVVVLLNDPWNVPAYLRSMDGFRAERERNGAAVRVPPFVGWLAVDAKNQRGAELAGLSHVVVWTQFAADELRRGGYTGTIAVVPLGVDHDIFTPRDRAEARRRVLPPGYEDAFVVGCVGRNQPRKRLDLTIEYFGEFARCYDASDAVLLLHCAPTGERGCDIQSLVKYHGLGDRVLLVQPPVGAGVARDELPWEYSTMDVYVTTTQGEGWGLPALEAMACGVPCVVPDYSGLGSWTGDAALRVACSASALSAPLNGTPYTIGGVPDRKAFIWALASLYRNTSLRDEYRARGLALAASLPWSRTGDAFVDELESVVGAGATRMRWPSDADHEVAI